MSPESTVDSWAPVFSDQLCLLNQIAKQVPSSHKLIVKTHFIDPYSWNRKEISELSKQNISFCNHKLDSFKLVKNSDLVMTIQGSVALEASLFGIPSIVFGDSPFKVFSSCVLVTP